MAFLVVLAPSTVLDWISLMLLAYRRKRSLVVILPFPPIAHAPFWYLKPIRFVVLVFFLAAYLADFHFLPSFPLSSSRVSQSSNFSQTG